VAFVEKDDLMLSSLTVRETLSYAATFRLPASTTPEQKAKRVDQIIMQLGLSKCGRIFLVFFNTFFLENNFRTFFSG
jgi:ABC-type multidrug transport system ATPase subunit